MVFFMRVNILRKSKVIDYQRVKMLEIELELELTNKDNEKDAKNIILKIKNRKNEAKNTK
jgi:hypothetical protein